MTWLGPSSFISLVSLGDTDAAVPGTQLGHVLLSACRGMGPDGGGLGPASRVSIWQPREGCDVVEWQRPSWALLRGLKRTGMPATRLRLWPRHRWVADSIFR